MEILPGSQRQEMEQECPIDRWCNPKLIFNSRRRLFVQDPWPARDRRRGCSGCTSTYLPTDVMASAGNIHLLGLQTAANIFPSPYCIIACDLTNHQLHSAQVTVDLSSIYAEAANRNHPLRDGWLVSSHRPLVVMDVNEGQGRDKE